MKNLSLKIETKAVRGYRGGDNNTGAISCPIYQSATFEHPSLKESTGYDYSRLQNPTREELERTIALLENGNYGFAFSSGMAAICTIFNLFLPGDHLIICSDLYGGTYRIFENQYKIYGIEGTYVDTENMEDIRKHLRSNTKAIFIETPTNPMMKVSDILKITELAKENKLLTIVDNTFLTPYFQQPLELGADIVVHSGTKYIGGHNDTLAGLLVVNEEALAKKIHLNQKSVGAVLAPFDSWLILRGIKTLSIRVERQAENALEIAKWLEKHEKVEKVLYIGLENHPGHEISKKQSSGFGSMISFVLKDSRIVEKLLNSLKIISFAESLGGVETLITYPMTQTHADIPKEIREARGIDNRLLRLSVGIENVTDLINDLEQALGDEGDKNEV